MSHTPPPTSLNTSDLAEVLFCCGLQESDHPSAEQVRKAIDDRIGACGGDSTACVALVAQEAGDHPETYTLRMRWALSTVSAAYRDLTSAA
ncbi:hypothetical protein BZB76_0672 [Actinomadura pelletieri DSM 43383]|uniref:Uncharacterized protein n=1 Tax=Actinomadura pelletieri DSM 43383 TaxID=1120940 RepID=A0A495QYM8_9ACTN|nr:hypothetical protein [Actinomadura pelletieri]RKS79222.1 hypothetical protein BZB76_0672 [Actinomadura pelletieri DSM 43383]